MVEINVRIDLPRQVLCDVLTNAVESGGHALWYWEGFAMANIDRDADLNVERFTFVCDHPEDGRTYTIEWEDIAPAVEEVLLKHHPLNDDIVAQIKTMMEPDNADVDAEAADILCQIVAFGEVIFG